MSLDRLLKPSLNWLLVFLPLAVILRSYGAAGETWVFISSCLSIIPLAGWMGRATEHLAERAGEGIGGLLNATFGNAAELIIAVMALRSGMLDIVKASLTGSIIGNILLVLGVALLSGGLRFKEQRFSASGARMQATMLTLAAIALIAPAAFHFLGDAEALKHEEALSAAISMVLLAAYGLSLLFSLRTHKHLFAGSSSKENPDPEEVQDVWPLKVSLAVLVSATVLVAWMSEILVGSVEHAAAAMGMNQIFIGVIVVAVIGNAAEHSTAVLMALKNRMDLSIGIAIGSSIQVALFIAPLLVLLSFWIAPQPMNLVFTPSEVLAVAVAVVLSGQIAGDGESNWLEGSLLLAVYLILAVVFYFISPGV